MPQLTPDTFGKGLQSRQENSEVVESQLRANGLRYRNERLELFHPHASSLPFGAVLIFRARIRRRGFAAVALFTRVCAISVAQLALSILMVGAFGWLRYGP